jgi:hypothetical protein
MSDYAAFTATWIMQNIDLQLWAYKVDRLKDSACWHLTVEVSTEASNIHFPRGVVSLHGSKNGPSLLK